MKRYLSLLLALVVALSCVSTMGIGVQAVEEQQGNQNSTQTVSTTWDGTTVQPSVTVSIDGIYYYKIYTGKELAYIAQAGGDWLTYNYILANDIVLNDVELSYDANGNLTVDADTLNQWTPIDEFRGIFDGNSFSISGVYVNTDSAAGFFANCRGDVSNLTITNSYIKGGSEVGGICGTFDKTGKDMTNCYFDGAVIGISSVGGLIGSNHTTNITDCGNYGDVWGTGDYVCGIVGSFYAYGIDNCFNEGNIYSTGNYVAGIAGHSDIYDIKGCINKGNVTGNKYVAGICGYIENASVYDSGNFGTIIGKDYVGGVCGYSIYGTVESWKSSIFQSYNTGAVSGENYVGGITGYTNYADVTNSYNVGNVTGTAKVGALIGHSESIWGKGIVSDCYYYKDDVINTSLNGFGNAPDADGVVCNKEASYFPILSDPNADPSYSNLGHVNHTYDQLKVDEKYLVSEATCTERAIYYKSCSCGKAGTETFKNGELKDHVYDQEKVDTAYLVSEATTSEQAVYKKSCICGKAGTETFKYGELLPFEFSDVPKNMYYYNPVMWAVENGITTGTGDGTTFKPNETCTRGQVVTFLWRTAGKPEPSITENPFVDVKTSDYFYKAVLWAKENNITSGTGDGTTFEPNSICNRAQIVTFLSRAKNGQPSSSENPFVDVPAGSYYYNPVLWAVENKITTGTGDGTTFKPNEDCTRGQVITFLYRAYK